VWKVASYLRWNLPSGQIPLLGLTIGVALFVAVQNVSSHPGQKCGQLGQVEEEWEIGLPSRHLMCVATIDGDLVYDRFVIPPHKRPQ